MTLWDDLALIARSTPIRLLFMFFERSKWSTECVDGLKVLTGLLKTLADTKVIEDIHGDLRLEAKANPNTKLNASHIQEVITSSRSLATRDIAHGSKVDKDYFVRHFRSASAGARVKDYEAATHKLPVEFSKVMGRKKWPTSNEDVLRKTAAAWAWITVGCAQLPEVAVDVGAGVCSALLLTGLVVRRTDSNDVWFSLGQATWAGLCWPLAEVGEGKFAVRHDSNASAAWQFVRNSLEWVAFRYQAAMTSGRVVVEERGEEPLVKASFRKQTSHLSFETLLRIAKAYDFSYNSQDSRDVVLEAIVRHVGVDDEAFVTYVLEREKNLPASRPTWIVKTVWSTQRASNSMIVTSKSSGLSKKVGGAERCGNIR